MSEQRNNAVSRSTVLASAGVAAAVSALILGVGAVGMMVASSEPAPAGTAAPATVLNLGAAQAAPAPGAPAAPAAPGAADAPLPAVVDPAAPAAPAAPGAPAAPAASAVPGASEAPAAATSARTASPTSIRDAKVTDLYVRSEAPTSVELEWQFAAFWNPRLPMGPKYEVSYNGNHPDARKALNQVMAASQTYDFFSLRGQASRPAISGNRMAVTFRGMMAGFPVQQMNYYYLRENGLWKFDWKRMCSQMQCNGNPKFGY